MIKSTLLIKTTTIRSLISIILSVFLFSCLSFFSLVFLGCQDNKVNQATPFLTIHDSRRVEVTIQNPPQRVISLGPNMTEIIFALGKGNLMVGRTDYCDFPEAVKKIPSVGDIMEPNLEIIVELAPDLIFASTHVSQKTINRLEQLGLCVVALEDSGNFEGLHSLIKDCATILNAESIASRLLKEMEEKQKQVILNSTEASPSVYFALGYGKGGDWTAGTNTFIDDMITIAGGVNIVTDSGWSYSKELLVENDPDIILIGKGKKEEFISLPIYRSLTASKTGNVFEIDEDIITRTSPRAIDGLIEIHKIFLYFHNPKNSQKEQ